LAAEEHLREVGFAEAFCPRRLQRFTGFGRTVEREAAVFGDYVLASVTSFGAPLWYRACRAMREFRAGLAHGFLGGCPTVPVSAHSCVAGGASSRSRRLRSLAEGYDVHLKVSQRVQ